MREPKADHSFPSRIAPTVKVADTEEPTPARFMQIALARIDRMLGAISRQIDDRTKPVDEYQVTSEYSGVSILTVEVLRQFDRISERITSVLVTGPPTTAFTLQLGDRFLNLTTDASGKVTIAPVSMLLGDNDRRILTSATAGNWTLELMGWADVRY
jgi:hypothetical protein